MLFSHIQSSFSVQPLELLSCKRTDTEWYRGQISINNFPIIVLSFFFSEIQLTIFCITPYWQNKAKSNWVSNSVLTIKGYVFYIGLLYLLVKRSIDSYCIAIHSPNFLARGKSRTGWTKNLGQFTECCQEKRNYVRHEEWEEKRTRTWLSVKLWSKGRNKTSKYHFMSAFWWK